MGCGALFPYGFPVHFGWVAFVILPTVARKLQCQAFHVFVPIGFGQYRGSGDAHETAIAFHHAMMRNARIGFESISINQKAGWLWVQFSNGPVHPLHRSPKDVHFVNFGRCEAGNGPSQSALLYDRSKVKSLIFSELLGVV